MKKSKLLFENQNLTCVKKALHQIEVISLAIGMVWKGRSYNMNLSTVTDIQRRYNLMDAFRKVLKQS
jgi:hypothetical protein